MKLKKITLVTRQSSLAVAQAAFVAERLSSFVEKVDLFKKQSDGDIRSIKDKSDFTTAIDQELFNNKADIAVHSLKDVDSQEIDGLKLPAFLMDLSDKNFRYDCILSKKPFDEIKDNFKLGTSSIRRSFQALLNFPGANIEGIRGNIDTRVQKLRLDNSLDAIILAKCGITRHPEGEKLVKGLNLTLLDRGFLPAPCQGIIGLRCLSENAEINDLLSKAFNSNDDRKVRKIALAERSLLKLLNADCGTALGLQAKILGDKIAVDAILYGKKHNLTANININIKGNYQEQFLLQQDKWQDLADAIKEEKI